MHSVTVMNVLRQRALPHVDFEDPASVLSSLNVRFPMDGSISKPFTFGMALEEFGHERVWGDPSASRIAQADLFFAGTGTPAIFTLTEKSVLLVVK